MGEAQEREVWNNLWTRQCVPSATEWCGGASKEGWRVWLWAPRISNVSTSSKRRKSTISCTAGLSTAEKRQSDVPTTTGLRQRPVLRISEFVPVALPVTFAGSVGGCDEYEGNSLSLSVHYHESLEYRKLAPVLALGRVA